jgi:ABC-type uncharacterized transport system YnjBCD ATPase subunit
MGFQHQEIGGGLNRGFHVNMAGPAGCGYTNLFSFLIAITPVLIRTLICSAKYTLSQSSLKSQIVTYHGSSEKNLRKSLIS